jgi:hypothetical protein
MQELGVWFSGRVHAWADPQNQINETEHREQAMAQLPTVLSTSLRPDRSELSDLQKRLSFMLEEILVGNW